MICRQFYKLVSEFQREKLGTHFMSKSKLYKQNTSRFREIRLFTFEFARLDLLFSRMLKRNTKIFILSQISRFSLRIKMGNVCHN